MGTKEKLDIVPGWVGGFAESNPEFAYPHPNLTSLPMLDNMANIDLLQRQQAVKWPEFSWETEKGSADPETVFSTLRSGYLEARIYRYRTSVFNHMPSTRNLFSFIGYVECRGHCDRSAGVG